MLTTDVIRKFHAKVPLPWSQTKIKKAGFEPTVLLIELGRELERCEDTDSPTAKTILNLLDELQMLS